MVPVAIKYLCKTDITDWANLQLTRIEERLGWTRRGNLNVWRRTVRLAEALLSLREIEYLGKSGSGPLSERRDHLIKQMLIQLEQGLGIPDGDDNVLRRVSVIRSKAMTLYGAAASAAEKQSFRASVIAAELVQDIASYPDCYLQPDQATDTRIVETIQRMQETLYGKADGSIPLHAVIQFDRPIVVPPQKSPRGVTDPLLEQLAQRLTTMLDCLALEANPIAEHRGPGSSQSATLVPSGSSGPSLER